MIRLGSGSWAFRKLADRVLDTYRNLNNVMIPRLILVAIYSISTIPSTPLLTCFEGWSSLVLPKCYLRITPRKSIVSTPARTHAYRQALLVGFGAHSKASSVFRTRDRVFAVPPKVEAIYTRFAPQKVSKIGGLLLRYAGKEEKLLRLVHRKYVKPAGAELDYIYLMVKGPLIWERCQ